MEKTLVLFKPDALEKRICSKILKRLEQQTDLSLVAIKLIYPDKDQIKDLYYNHQDTFYFDDLVKFMTSGSFIAMVWEGNNACTQVRNLIGAKHPENSLPGTIRGDLAENYPENLIHGSDHTYDSEREIAIFFKEDEL